MYDSFGSATISIGEWKREFSKLVCKLKNCTESQTVGEIISPFNPSTKYKVESVCEDHVNLTPYREFAIKVTINHRMESYMDLKDVTVGAIISPFNQSYKYKVESVSEDHINLTPYCEFAKAVYNEQVKRR